MPTEVKQLAISVIERVDTTIISDVESYHKNGSTNLVSLTLALTKVRSLLEFSTKPTLRVSVLAYREDTSYTARISHHEESSPSINYRRRE
tara:strand:- start:100 stop:372 length:273 start_codon:yes stop_codon:yes gene_type:complete